MIKSLKRRKKKPKTTETKIKSHVNVKGIQLWHWILRCLVHCRLFSVQVSFQANPSRLKTDSPQLSHSYIGHPVFNNSHQTTGLRITYTNKLDTKITAEGPRARTRIHRHTHTLAQGRTDIREWSSLLWETYLHKGRVSSQKLMLQ